MRINHSYKIEFEPVHSFTYQMYEPGIGTLEYKDRIEPHLHTIWDKLNKNIHSRQAVLTLNRPDFPSCLLSYQAQIQGSEIYITVNFRSQAEEYVKRDSRMILYWTNIALNRLNHLIATVNIRCNVGNYHTIAERL